MRILRLLALLLAVPSLAGAWGFGAGEDLDPSEAKNRRIVVFEAGTAPQARADAVSKAGGRVLKHLGLIRAVAAHFPDNRLSDIRSQPGVTRVDEDLILATLEVRGQGKPSGGGETQPAQQTPWGITRIGSTIAWASTSGLGIRVAVVDTGIDTAHPDLAANLKGGINTINLTKGYGDDNGHGTHVAGTIAAVSNTVGVVGVGPQIHLYAVKVLGRSGSGWLSDIIEGLQWCAANGMQVANMSLGSSSDNQSFHDAVTAAAAAGVTLVAAAGNDSGGPVGYPARYPEVIAVSASNASDQLAYFSSVGPEVDLIAPGQDVFSTYKGKTYATLSGTSMASPHAAGAAALEIARVAGLTPAQVLANLRAKAQPLPGLTAVQQGSGLVRAD